MDKPIPNMDKPIPKYVVQDGKHEIRTYRGFTKVMHLAQLTDESKIILIQSEDSIDIWELHHPGALDELFRYYQREKPWVPLIPADHSYRTFNAIKQ